MFFLSKSRPGRLWTPALRAILACALLVVAFAAHAQQQGSQVLRGHVPAILSRLAPTGRLAATRQLHLEVTLPLRNQDALRQLLHDLYDPTSPRYRHFLKPAQFTAAFGPSADDYQAVQAFAAAHHLRVTGLYPNRALIDLDGAGPDIETAFHVTMQEYRHPTENRTFYAPDREPSVDLATPLQHISGLDNLGTCKPLSTAVPIAAAELKGAAEFKSAAVSNQGATKPSAGSGPGSNYMGYDFRNAYAPGVTLTGSGQSVALLEFDFYNANDIQTYESQAGLPSVTCSNVIVDNYSGFGHSSGGQFEVTLDIEVAISMAPGANSIIVYEAPPSDWIDVLQRIANDDLANQISCSWYQSGESENTSADTIFSQMAAQGQSFYTASGDNAAYTGLISFPDDDPNITVVGGTQLSTPYGSGPYSSETVWTTGTGIGSGGGISTQYSIPTWQQATSMLSNAGSTTMRNVPDVALTAANVYVYQGNSYSAYGTSCAAPLWAGFTALINQQAAANGYSKVGLINSAIYALASSSGYSAAFHDITAGNNTSPSSPNQFYATTNYDLCTGLGTPAGQTLINDLSAAPDGLSISFGSLLTGGKSGGPFSPSNEVFALKNLTSSPITWVGSATQSWLALSATTGSVPANASITVTASVNSNANTLASGTYSDTISFVDSSTQFVQSRPVVLTIIPSPVISSALTATATTSTTFSYQITATNNPTSYSASGLPSGLTVSTSTGAISGKPTVTGPYNVTIGATNGGGTGTATLVLTVVPPPPVINSATTAKTVVNTAFSYTIKGTNTPTSFNATSLPSGLSVNTTSGVISGTTTNTGTTNVSISASNAGGTGSATLQITTQPSPPVISSSNTASGVKGTAFSYQITASNSPTTFGASSLPVGLSVSISTGIISGTPSATGTTNATITAANVTGTGSATLAITILPPAPAITSTNSVTPVQGAAFSYQITATNTPSSFSATNLPSGLSVSNSSGIISGTATITGTSNATISASNAGGTGTSALFFNVIPPAPVITSTNNATAAQGIAFTYQITATNNPTSFSASNLPAGLLVNASNGLVSGTPTTLGTGNAVVAAINLGGTGVATVYFNVLPQPPVITSTNNVTGTQGSPFSYQITATNNPASYTASNLPAGLSVTVSTGLVSGTPSATGTGNALISAINSGGTGSAILFYNVVMPPPVITSTTNTTATVGAAFSYQITATNQPAGYSAAGLPIGLDINASSGLITGTLSSSGTISVTIGAANASGTGSATITILAETPFAAWQSSTFTTAQLADPTISGATAEPANDGIPNLLKYALGLNPFAEGNASLPVGSVVTTGSGNYLSITFPEVISATDITYTVQVSTDTQTWNSGPGYTNPATPVGTSNGVTQFYNVQAVQPATAQPFQAIRLQVTGP
jgi:hypothetical protein